MTQSKESTAVEPRLCPICYKPSIFIDRIHEVKDDVTGDWYHCNCGVVFQKDKPAHNCYDKVYKASYELAKESKIRGQHAAKTFAPLIEEATFGRMLLDVGFNTHYVMDFFRERGWIAWGIDDNKDLVGEGKIYKGNFETHDFSPNIDKEKLKSLTGKEEIRRTFDLIWMSHVLEHFDNPILALQKAYDLLSPTGIIYIAVPDIDFIKDKTGVSQFPHWKANEHYIMWSERALVRELERIGFKVFMHRRNISSRFTSWYDVQILAQKEYF